MTPVAVGAARSSSSASSRRVETLLAQGVLVALPRSTPSGDVRGAGGRGARRSPASGAAEAMRRVAALGVDVARPDGTRSGLITVRARVSCASCRAPGLVAASRSGGRAGGRLPHRGGGAARRLPRRRPRRRAATSTSTPALRDARGARAWTAHAPSVWEERYVVFRVAARRRLLGHALSSSRRSASTGRSPSSSGSAPTARVADVAVMAYREAYGGEIRSARFLAQYRGKGAGRRRCVPTARSRTSPARRSRSRRRAARSGRRRRWPAALGARRA